VIELFPYNNDGFVVQDMKRELMQEKHQFKNK